MSVPKGKHSGGQVPVYHQQHRLPHGLFRAQIQHGPNEQAAGFHVGGSGAYPVQGSAIPNNAPSQMRMPMHNAPNLQVPPQQPPPQPPQTSTPPAQDIKQLVPPSLNYNPPRNNHSPAFYNRQSPPTRIRPQSVVNIAAQPPHSIPLTAMPTTVHYFLPMSVPNIPHSQYAQRAHGQTNNANYMNYSMVSAASGYYPNQSAPNYFMAAQSNTNLPPFNPAMNLQRTFPQAAGTSPMNIQPTVSNFHQQPNVNTPNSVLVQPPPPPQVNRQKPNKRSNALPIIDPNTGKNIMEPGGLTDSSSAVQDNIVISNTDLHEENDFTSPVFQVRAEFASKVAKVASDDNLDEESPEHLNGSVIINTHMQQNETCDFDRITPLQSHVTEFQPVPPPREQTEIISVSNSSIPVVSALPCESQNNISEAEFSPIDNCDVIPDLNPIVDDKIEDNPNIVVEKSTEENISQILDNVSISRSSKERLNSNLTTVVTNNNEITKEKSGVKPFSNVSNSNALNKQDEKPKATAQISVHLNGETTPEQEGKANQRPVSKKNKKMRDINKKGSDKEGASEMDAFKENNQEEKPVPVNNIAPAALTTKSNNIKKEDVDVISIKNEENAKCPPQKTEEPVSPIINNVDVTTEASPVVASTKPALKYNYREGQWSPVNRSGEKKYERDFLLGLQTDPKSMKKPENLPNLDVVLPDPANRRSASQTNYFSGSRGGGVDFTPNFIKSGQSLNRGQMPNRKSLQGMKTGGKMSSLKGNPTITHITINNEFKLRETENAWKPARFSNNKDLSDEERKTQDLFKKVRSILNKLTPQKFDKLVNQIKVLPIDTPARLKGVIDLLFDKAIDESGFAAAYAKLCNIVADIEVKDRTEEKGLIFKKLLLSKCQTEFERNDLAELNSGKRLEGIRACKDSEKKKELRLHYEEEERRIRRKSVGNIRFIGELFKLKMLTTSIMYRCIQHLLSVHEEESLECLCKLLSTIGKELDLFAQKNPQNKDADLDGYFKSMQELAHKRENSKISSRVRFMLQDVIDLRLNNWIPRRNEVNPTTIDQIQRDADRESLEMHLALNQRKPDYRMDDNRKNRRNNSDDKDGWQNVVSNKNYRTNHSYQYDSSRMQAFKQQNDSISLGSASQFNRWGRGADSKPVDKADSRIATNNMYSALSNKDREEKKHSGNVSRSGKITPSPSIEKERMVSGFKEAMDSDRHSHRVQQRSSRPPSRDRTPAKVDETTVAASAAVTKTLTEDEILRKSMLIIDEYVNYQDVEEATTALNEFVRQAGDIVFEIIVYSISKNATYRVHTAQLFTKLIDNNILSSNTILTAFEKLTKQIIDFEWQIDMPFIWSYFAEMIAPLIKCEKITFSNLHLITKCVGPDKIYLLPLIEILSKETNESWLSSKWLASKLQLSDFYSNPNSGDAVKILKVLSKKGEPAPTLDLKSKLLCLITDNKMDYDSIFKTIDANFGDQVQDLKFIRALTTAVCEASMDSKNKINLTFFEKISKLIRRYVDQEETKEIECLLAIAAHVHKLEHPQGLLLNLFNSLWESGIISSNAFYHWRTTNVGEGKGVAIKSLVSFFTVLDETELSDDAS